MFKFKKDKTWDKPFSEKIAKRVAMIPTPDLAMWADQALSEIGRGLPSHRNPDTLKALLEGAEALHALIYELNKRNGNTL